MHIILLLISQESEYLAWANAVIDKQYDLAMTSITVIIALAVILLGGTWYTNFFLSRREMKNIVNSLKVEMEKKYRTIPETIDSKLSNEIKTITKGIDDSIEGKMLMFEGDKARLFAITASQAKLWDCAAVWWSRATKSYAKVEDEILLRTAVEAIIISLKECTQFDEDSREVVQQNITYIPTLLHKEKKQIQELIESLHAKAVKTKEA